MNIDKYIDWLKIWIDEVYLDSLEEEKIEDYKIVKAFALDKKVEINLGECFTDGDGLHFMFSETGGQNESDTQGWSRDYSFTVNEDFEIIRAEYGQG